MCVMLIISCGRKAPEGMIFVKGSTFQMGSNDGSSKKKPIHSATVSDFYIGKTEVTQKEWKKIMGNNPSNFKGDNLPVEKISLYDAVEFCNKKSDKEGLTRCYSGSGKNTVCNFNANGYRLPTIDEWLYASIGGNKSNSYTYSGSDKIDEIAWYSNNSNEATHEVGTKRGNELGIYDMSGNVMEWLYDISGYYLKGGSWNMGAKVCQVDFHCLAEYPEKSYDGLGFRLLRSSK